MISLFNIRSPFFSPQKLDKFKRKSTFTKFNYELFKLNENLREKSRDKGFNYILPRKKTGNIYLDNMITMVLYNHQFQIYKYDLFVSYYIHLQN